MIDKKYITHNRKPFFEIGKNFIKENSVVLDIGSGNGEFAIHCKRNDFFLLDGNENTVKALKKEFKNVTFGVLPKLPYENLFFDIIHCSHIVEHLSPQVLYDTLKEIDRCLKNNGYIIISTPLMWEGFYDDLSHVKPYNPDLFVNLLCSNGSNKNRSREKISWNYDLIKLQYRYMEKIDSWKAYYIAQNSIIVKIIFGVLSRILKKFGFAKLKKTGYTIVLKKI